MAEIPADTSARLARLLDGELSAPEQRRLAQAALDDPELFDALTAASAVSAMRERYEAEAPPAETRQRVQTHRFRTAAIAVAAVAATIVLVLAYQRRPTSSGSASSPIASSPSRAATAGRLVPVTVAPILLTAHLAADAERPPAAFRTDDTSRHVPKISGAVLSASAGVIETDLGSLDGVTRGSVLSIFRDGSAVTEAGRMTITTVFRERSRGRGSDGGAVRAGDEVRVAPAVHVAALLDQIAARRSVGDLEGARAVAETAAARAQQSAVSADLRAEVLNELGTIQIEQRDYDSAARTLEAAQPLATGVTALRVMSNRGALAAIRGDRTSAEALYRQARALAAAEANLTAERAAIDKNLDGLVSAR